MKNLYTYFFKTFETKRMFSKTDQKVYSWFHLNYKSRIQRKISCKYFWKHFKKLIGFGPSAKSFSVVWRYLKSTCPEEKLEQNLKLKTRIKWLLSIKIYMTKPKCLAECFESFRKTALFWTLSSTFWQMFSYISSIYQKTFFEVFSFIIKVQQTAISFGHWAKCLPNLVPSASHLQRRAFSAIFL